HVPHAAHQGAPARGQLSPGLPSFVRPRVRDQVMQDGATKYLLVFPVQGCGLLQRRPGCPVSPLREAIVVATQQGAHADRAWLVGSTCQSREGIRDAYGARRVRVTAEQQAALQAIKVGRQFARGEYSDQGARVLPAKQSAHGDLLDFGRFPIRRRCALSLERPPSTSGVAELA